MSNIAVIGGINHDIVIRVPRIPERGETIHRGQIAHYSGGKGANQAVAAARMGAEVSMIGRVGEDEYGVELIKNLTSEGIDVRYVYKDSDAQSGIG